MKGLEARKVVKTGKNKNQVQLPGQEKIRSEAFRIAARIEKDKFRGMHNCIYCRSVIRTGKDKIRGIWVSCKDRMDEVIGIKDSCQEVKDKVRGK
jgi:hypothetical protein